MRIKWSGAAFGAAIIGAALAAGANAAELPAGPGRELVERACQECHDLEMVFAAAGATREEWAGAVEEMTTYGLKATPDERARILDYLATYLGPKTETPR
jgi:cytochrome c5